MGARGAEWETIVDETVADNIYAIRTAKRAVAELNAELQDGQPLHWRDVLPLVLPANTNLSLQDPAVIESSNGGGESNAATGEMSATSTLQFKRNRKAIENILSELQTGEISEAKARVLLSSIGLVEKNIDALIADALDGSGRLESMEGQADG